MENKQYIEAEVKKQEKGFEAILSTSATDRLGESINQKGWILDTYLRNPVVLWAHQNQNPPVAKATEVWVDEALGLRAKGVWAETPFAQELKYLVENGFINSVSVGFIPVGKDKQELLEVSFVNIPALSEALIISRKQNLSLVTKALEDLMTFQIEKEKPIEIKLTETKEKNIVELKEVERKVKIKTELAKTLILADKIFETLRRMKTEKETTKAIVLADKIFETLLKIERKK